MLENLILHRLMPLLVLLTGCGILTPEAPDEGTVLDGTIEGMTPSQVRQHLVGDEEFAQRFAIADGLGPIFVATSCEQCHVADGKGHPVFNLTRFGRADSNGVRPPWNLPHQLSSTCLG